MEGEAREADTRGGGEDGRAELSVAGIAGIASITGVAEVHILRSS